MSDESQQLQAELSEARTNGARRKQARQWAEQKEAAVRGNAASDDGKIRATVDRAGMLLDLELSPEIRKLDATGVGELITKVVQNATADARSQVRQIYTSLQNEGMIRDLPRSLLEPPTVERVSVPTKTSNTTVMPARSTPEPTRDAGRNPDTDDDYFNGLKIMRDH